MDIEQAKQFLGSIVKSKEEELGTFKLALSILSGNFVADFTNTELVRKEVDEKNAQLSAKIVELTNALAEKEQQTKRAEEAEAESAEQTIIITDLNVEKVDLSKKVTDLTQVTQIVNDALGTVATAVSSALEKVNQ